LEVTYLGHSAFRLRGKEVTIVTDPFPPSPGFSMGKPSADIVTISHKSPHHSFREGVGNSPHFVDGPGEYEVSDVLIAGVATTTEPGRGAINTAYVMRFDDLAVCHLGDVTDKLSDNQVEEIGSIDVLLIPAGGGKALGPTDAAEVVSQLDPSVVIPMHYRLNGGAVVGLEPVDLFCREMGLKEFTAEPKLTLTKSSLSQEIRVVVLEQRRV
jgi:L-ascorbate metabolism protein UlaG (beta-lactamase superfamily)